MQKSKVSAAWGMLWQQRKKEPHYGSDTHENVHAKRQGNIGLHGAIVENHTHYSDFPPQCSAPKF